MSEFIERTASLISLSARKLVYGAGINDSWYATHSKSDSGIRTRCPYYVVWADMIERVYSIKHKEKYPTYIGCSVAKEWITFSNFRAWMEKQDWRGKHLDKDILVCGNKHYSDNTCIFISGAMNSLLCNSAAIRGDNPQGVCWDKVNNKYEAYCNVKGKKKKLGRFKSVNKAEYEYLIFKADLIKQTAYEEEAASNPKLQQGLLRHAKIFTDRSLLISP